jgi:hypothetical protein
MQRQIRILNRPAHRGGFLLIMAVFLMLLLSLMLLKMLSYSSDDAQRVVNDYILEQAQLVAYGATEYAMLKASGDDRTAACTDDFNLSYPATGSKLLNARVQMQYVWLNGSAPGGTGCSNSAITGSTITVTNPEQNGSVYVLVTVASDSSAGLDEPIRFVRKTLQKL